MVAKVVVEQHQAGGFAGHVGAALAHDHANVCTLEGWRVVHAVSGHGDELAPRLQGLHDTDFLRRVDPGVNSHPLHAGLQRLLIHGGQIGPREHRVSMLLTMPRRSAIACAVAGWSPVIMTGVMPAAMHSATAALASGRGGSISPTSPISARALSTASIASPASGNF